MEQKLFDAAAKLPETHAQLDTSQLKTALGYTNSVRRVVLTLAACAAAICIILFGAIGLAAEVNEYQTAIAYFSENGLSTDGLSRKEIKTVYTDIITGSFTHPKTAGVLAGVQSTTLQKMDPRVREMYDRYFHQETQNRPKQYEVLSITSGMHITEVIEILGKPYGFGPTSDSVSLEWRTVEGWRYVFLVVPEEGTDGMNIFERYTQHSVIDVPFLWDPIPVLPERYQQDYGHYFDLKREHKPSEADILSVTQGMHVKEVVESIGKPHGMYGGSGMYCLLWQSAEGQVYSVQFWPADDAPQDLLPIERILEYGTVTVKATPWPPSWMTQDKDPTDPTDPPKPTDPTDPTDPDLWVQEMFAKYFDLGKTHRPTMAEVLTIQEGTPVSEVVRLIGKPHGFAPGHNMTALQWETAEGYTCIIDLRTVRDSIDTQNAFELCFQYCVVDWVVPLVEPDVQYDSTSENYDEAGIYNAVKKYFIQREAYLLGEANTINNVNPGLVTDEDAHKTAIAKAGIEWLRSDIVIHAIAYWDSHAQAVATETVTYRENGVEKTEAIIHRLQLGPVVDGSIFTVCDMYYEVITGFKSCSYIAPPYQPMPQNPTDPTDPTKPCAHVWGQWIVVAEATCDRAGHQERSCSNCNEKQTQEIPKREHEESDWIIDKPADVGVEGHKHTECIYCHLQMWEEIIPAITEDHQHNSTTWVIRTYPGCTTSGTTQRICSCGEVLETKSIAPVGHKEVVDKAVAATCISGGLTEGKHCSTCQTVLVPQQQTPATGHSMATKTVEATDKEPEYILHYCTTCNYSYKETVTPSSPIKFKSNGNGTCIVTGLYDITLEHVVIPEKSPAGDIVVAIGERVFLKNDTVITITLPATVTEAGEFAFSKCTNLTAVYGSQHIATFAGSVFANSTALKEVDISGAKTIGNYLFSGCTGLSSVTLPEQLQTIPQGMFSSCVSLVEIPWPKEVKTIGNGAFSSCGVEHLVIPDTVEVIEMYAFRYCAKLQSVQLSGSVRSIGAMAFEQCIALKDVVFAEGLEGLGRLAFTSCDSLESVVLPTTVTRIGDSCFSYCSALASVSLPEGLTQIPESMFSQCVALKNVVFSSRLEEIGRFAFWATDITELVLPDSCVSIGQDAFRSCESLKTVKFGKNLTQIESSTFSGCKSLTEVILPDCVQSIGMWAFSNCSSLKKVYLGNSITYIGSAAFQNCTGLTSVFLPKSLLTINPSSTEQSPFTGCAGTLDLYSDATNTNVTWDRYFGRVTCGVSYEEYLGIING